MLPNLQNQFGPFLPQTTGMMGQSLGALATLYAQTRPIGSCFGSAVCISLSSWYPNFLDYFFTHSELLSKKEWIFICGETEGLGHEDVKQFVTTYNQEIIEFLSQHPRTCHITAHWDPGAHHENLPSRYQKAILSFFS